MTGRSVRVLRWPSSTSPRAPRPRPTRTRESARVPTPCPGSLTPSFDTLTSAIRPFISSNPSNVIRPPHQHPCSGLTLSAPDSLTSSKAQAQSGIRAGAGAAACCPPSINGQRSTPRDQQPSPRGPPSPRGLSLGGVISCSRLRVEAVADRPEVRARSPARQPWATHLSTRWRGRSPASLPGAWQRPR